MLAGNIGNYNNPPEDFHNDLLDFDQDQDQDQDHSPPGSPLVKESEDFGDQIPKKQKRQLVKVHFSSTTF